MRILTVLTYYRPHTSGLTIYAERLAKALVQRGHEVTVLTSQFEKDLPLEEVQDGVRIRRVPVAFNASFVPQQKLFYALQGMGKVAEIHPRVFRAIHVEKINLSKEDAIMAWMAKQPGIDMAKFKEMYASFNVASQAQRAAQLQEAYGVEGTPSMGVAGRFYTDGTMAGSLNAVLQVVDHLVAVSRKG